MYPNNTNTRTTPNATQVQQSQRRTSQELLAGARELLIEHEGCCYCLRLTRQNKLILTK